MRSIYITIRGTDYTSRMWQKHGKNVDEATRKQQEFNRNLKYMMFGGLMFTAMAGTMAIALGKIIEKTSLGALYMTDFSNAAEKLMYNLGEAITAQWGPAIEGFLGWLDELGDNETFKMIIGKTAVPLMLTIGVIGVTMLVTGFIGKFLSMLLPLLISAGAVPAGTTVGGLGAILAMPITIALGIYLLWEFADPIGDFIKDNIIDPIDSAIKEYWKNVEKHAEMGDIGSNILEMFRAWFFPEGTYGGVPKKAQGSRNIPETGLYYLHQGEAVIPSSYTGGFGGIGGNDGTVNHTNIKVDINIENVNTEADEDRLVKRVGYKISKELANRLG